LSTVGQSAPYFRTDGDWNGSVWMPHQWIIWKTLLDLGQGDFAWQIAHTALTT
jgi:neutral trehalase